MDKEIYKQTPRKERETNYREVTQEVSQRSDPLAAVVEIFDSVVDHAAGTKLRGIMRASQDRKEPENLHAKK